MFIRYQSPRPDHHGRHIGIFGLVNQLGHRGLTHLFNRIPGYLAILATHNIPCTRFTETDPGQVLYEDPHQIVVIPHT